MLSLYTAFAFEETGACKLILIFTKRPPVIVGFSESQKVKPTDQEKQTRSLDSTIYFPKTC